MPSFHMTKQYDHDCENCTYIGTTVYRDTHTIDIYLSCENSFDRYIVRFSNDPADYITVRDDENSLLWSIAKKAESRYKEYRVSLELHRLIIERDTLIQQVYKLTEEIARKRSEVG